MFAGKIVERLRPTKKPGSVPTPAPSYVMPNRLPTDKGVEIRRQENGRIFIFVKGDGQLSVSEFNAWRLFGGLCAVLLGLPLKNDAQKSLEL